MRIVQSINTLKIKLVLNTLMLVFLAVSCKTPEPPTPYQYEKNPTFTWGFAEFYGNYFSNYQIDNNVLTLNLFSDKLYVNDKSQLDGHGQYLILQDVFVAPGDTLLPEGEYEVAETGAPFTFFGGKKYEDNREVIPSGAYMYYVEVDPLRSKMVYVTAGKMTVSMSREGVYTINCDFIVDGKTELKATFYAELPHLDRVATTAVGVARKTAYQPKMPLGY